MKQTPILNTVIPNPLLNEAFFIYNVTRASMDVKSRFHKAIEKYKIAGPQFIIMYLILKKHHLSQKEIGACMSVDKASMVKFLDQLEKEKYVKRNEDSVDRRIKLISLTPKGVATVNKLEAVLYEVEDKFLAEKLTAAEAKTLKSLLKKLIKPIED